MKEGSRNAGFACDEVSVLKDEIKDTLCIKLLP
jgi:hypothetical protein